MFSKACEYGIRAVICIMSKGDRIQKVSIKEICDEIEAPEHFTAKILQDLVRKKLISSVKGPGGGFYISLDQKNIRLIDIVTAIDGDELFTGCALGLHQCSEVNPCPLHNQFKEVRDRIHNLLMQTTIQQLSQQLIKGQTVLKTLVSSN